MKITNLEEVEYQLPNYTPIKFGDFDDCLRSTSYDDDLTSSIHNDDIIYLLNLCKQHNKQMDILSHKTLGLVIRFVDLP